MTKASNKPAEQAVALNAVSEAGSEVREAGSAQPTKDGWKDVSRKELLEKAFARVKKKLESEDELNPSTIGALEKLLKIDRDIVAEEEVPHEIRVLWQEVNDESSSEE